MRVTFGWLLKLWAGLVFAAMAPLAWSSGMSLVAFALINAIGFHVLLNALKSDEAVLPPKPILIGLGIAACLAVGAAVSAQPMNGCEACLASGHSWYWCVAVYGALCF